MYDAAIDLAMTYCMVKTQHHKLVSVNSITFHNVNTKSNCFWTTEAIPVAKCISYKIQGHSASALLVYSESDSLKQLEIEYLETS